MKKIFFILSVIISASSTGQTAQDAMFFSRENISGTARFSAMSGAFGAVGGDLSAVHLNPAGAAIFNNNQMAVSLLSYNMTNKSDYFGSKSTAKVNTFDLNQLGAVWIFIDASKKSNWNKIAITTNYQTTAIFDNALFSTGINPSQNISNYFLSYANGVSLPAVNSNPYADLSYAEQQTYLGYQGFLINPIAGNTNNQYESNVSKAGNYFQQHRTKSTGYNSQFTLNLAANYKKNYYFGVNLNFHFLDYTKSTSFYEDYYGVVPANTPITGVQSINFDNDLHTYGGGISLNVGAIAKVTPNFRAGIAYQTPTWYALNDELQQTLKVDCPDCNLANGNPFFADPELKIIYPLYKLQTPSKTTASLAYIFGKSGLLSFDYILKNYASARFNPKNDFESANKNIETTFANTGEIRVGGEFKVKQWSGRAGFRTEKSPYKNAETIGELKSYSAGFGYSWGATKFDFAYILSQNTAQNAFFGKGFTDFANITSHTNQLVGTLLFEF